MRGASFLLTSEYIRIVASPSSKNLLNFLIPDKLLPLLLPLDPLLHPFLVLNPFSDFVVPHDLVHFVLVAVLHRKPVWLVVVVAV